MADGSLEGFFGSSRGLRKGDPFSPLLFVLVMKAFTRMLKDVVENGSIEGIVVGNGERGGLSISHLLFVDDTLILCGAEESQFCNLRCLLLCFEAVLGFKINLSKSEAILIGCVDNVQELTTTIGCRVSYLSWASLECVV